jgi:hypothetical protein
MVKINKASLTKGIIKYDIIQYVYKNYTTIIISSSNFPIPNTNIYDQIIKDSELNYLIRYINKDKYEYNRNNNKLIKYYKYTGLRLNY